MRMLPYKDKNFAACILMNSHLWNIDLFIWKSKLWEEADTERAVFHQLVHFPHGCKARRFTWVSMWMTGAHTLRPLSRPSAGSWIWSGAVTGKCCLPAGTIPLFPSPHCKYLHQVLRTVDTGFLPAASTQWSPGAVQLSPKQSVPPLLRMLMILFL